MVVGRVILNLIWMCKGVQLSFELVELDLTVAVAVDGAHYFGDGGGVSVEVGEEEL